MTFAIFSDLDGCLLDKQTYSFAPAIATLEKAKQMGVPVVLASSKTKPEMLRLAREMNLAPAPIICENGGAILWNQPASSTEAEATETLDEPLKETILGATRSDILDLLSQLKSKFHFRSFRDLGVAGIAQATGLDEPRAEQAADRRATEPLLWDDREERLEEFQEALKAADLTLTRGGRFWHIAGQTTKGIAMRTVVGQLYTNSKTIAVGDSPIDQSMLDIADHPIGIPQPNGPLLVNVPSRGLVAASPGPTGWTECVGRVLG